MSNVLSVRRHTLEILCKISGRIRMPAYCSVPVPYAKLMPNVCNVHQRMGILSHTSAYVGGLRCGVSTPKKKMVCLFCCV